MCISYLCISQILLQTLLRELLWNFLNLHIYYFKFPSQFSYSFSLDWSHLLFLSFFRQSHTASKIIRLGICCGQSKLICYFVIQIQYLFISIVFRIIVVLKNKAVPNEIFPRKKGKINLLIIFRIHLHSTHKKWHDYSYMDHLLYLQSISMPCLSSMCCAPILQSRIRVQ